MKYCVYYIILCVSIIPISMYAQTSPTTDQSIGAIDTTQLQNLDLDAITNGLFDQINLPYNIEEQIVTDITPSYPSPGETVTIRLSNNSINLNKLQITWRENNRIVLDQIGAIEYNFVMGQLGDNKSISVTITKNDGTAIERAYFMAPSETDLIVAPQTYTPPFYKGRAQTTHQSRITVYAMPRMLDDFDRLIPAEDYTYKWSVDGKVLLQQSGYGKNTLVYDNDLLTGTIKVSVVAEPRNFSGATRASISITPQEPMLLLYEKNPIYGTIFERAVTGTYTLGRNEITLEAVPYFFSNPNSNFTWTMNGQVIPNNANPREVTFRIENDEAGRSEIGIQGTSSDKILQSAQSIVTLLFEKISSTTKLNTF